MVATPTTPKGNRTLQHILTSARVVFGRDGYVNARMIDVAEEAGLSLGGLYRYVSNKDDVFERVIADVHDELYASSRPRDHTFAQEPFEALREANRAYLEHYSANRDVMRSLVEASAVNVRYREIWWNMRTRHAERFAQAMAEHFGITELDGVSAALASNAMSCMVEQVAYVWYAHADMHTGEVPIDGATEIVTRAWYRLFFPGRPS